jgi:hypothetical protein
MIEILFLIAVLFAVFVLFYRQAINDYNILQIEVSKIHDLPRLLTERSPIVIRSVGQPKLFIPATLKANNRLLSYPLAPGFTLAEYLDAPTDAAFRMPLKARQQLADESGLRVWAEHTWYPKFFSQPFFENVYTMLVEAQVGSHGLRKTTASVTVIYPTSTGLDVTLLTEKQEVALPKTWQGRIPEQLTIQDTPLVGEIKYITVKVRPGTLLCVPPHWFVSVQQTDTDKQNKKACLWVWMEIHNPISRLSAIMNAQIDS